MVKGTSTPFAFKDKYPKRVANGFVALIGVIGTINDRAFNENIAPVALVQLIFVTFQLAAATVVISTI